VTFSGDSVSGSWSKTVPCPSDASISADNTYELNLRGSAFESLEGHRVPTAFRGELVVSSEPGNCPNIVIQPITWSLEVTRKA
jgi:hypothetical protein